ncbi:MULTISPECIES: hypothetical protein [unclassified Lebetimonas]|uniref:hypothetical protein n=1 Tax=unclassified Lebetimonas TaxID=2648158 RepID=UPI00046482D5|nr:MULTISPECIES: hypothetical protein [unclassified Lebetimonas]
MHTLLAKLADWLIEKEEKDAEKCDIPDEIIDEWLEILKKRREHILKEAGKDSEEYDMIKELIKKVEHIKHLREKNVKLKNKTMIKYKYLKLH